MQIGDSTLPNKLRKLTLKRILTLLLIGMMYLVVLLSTIDLGYKLFSDIISSPLFLLDVNELLEILGLFLLVLIAIELLETIQAYLDERKVHVEIVMEVGMIAIARKVIILDIKETAPLSAIAIGVLLIALAIGYYLFKHQTPHLMEKEK
ncbi:MAG: phosphate-starvation-inducible PsiE family protein [Longilinea sp.]|nr:phosphate-starvation-inducible PsiE family protein [Longilinea sp.]MCA1953842.1 phosphate-starvation-inducible PsiE family protein [Anaerolinea sp.]